MPKSVKIVICSSLILIFCAASAYFFYFKEMLAIKGLDIEAVDLETASDGRYMGTFESAYKAYNVEAVVRDHRIEKVEIETGDGFINHYDRLADALSAKIVEAQQNNVDAVTGATVSSKAVLKALEIALKSAPIID